MYKNPKFRQCFKWILIITLLQTGLKFLAMTYLQETVNFGLFNIPEKLNWYQSILYSIHYYTTLIALWLGIGYVFDDLRKEAYLMLGALLIFPPSLAYLIIFITENIEVILIAGHILQFVLFLGFGFLVFKDNRAWWFALMSLTLSTVTNIQFNTKVAELIAHTLDIFGLKEAFVGILAVIGGNLFTLMFKSVILPTLFLLISYAIYTLKNHRNFLAFQTIDLSNTYSRKMATVLFIILSTGLFLLFTVNPQLDFLEKLTNTSFILADFGVIFTAYLLALFYRNFLVEYSIAIVHKIKGWYFILNIPLVGIIVWFYSLAKRKITYSLSQKIAYLKEARKEDNNNIKMFLIFLLIILGILTVIKSHRRELIFSIIGITISIMLFGWYLAAHSAIWKVLGILAILIIAMPEDMSSIRSLVNGLTSAIILYPLFHLSELKNIAELPEETKPEETVW